jgi:hypothetical protein
MALKMKMLAPDLWNILGLLLVGDQRSWRQCAEKDSNGDLVMFKHLHDFTVENARGNLWVKIHNPYPYPQKPLPSAGVGVLAG